MLLSPMTVSCCNKVKFFCHDCRGEKKTCLRRKRQGFFPLGSLPQLSVVCYWVGYQDPLGVMKP